MAPSAIEYSADIMMRNRGRSAPSLAVAPIASSRSLADRVLHATIGTEYFKDLLKHANRLKRHDICHIIRANGTLGQAADTFSKGGDTPSEDAPKDADNLGQESKTNTFGQAADTFGRVHYKHGMRKYVVAYRNEVIFPPSIPSDPTLIMPPLKSAALCQGDVSIDITEWVRQCAGPCNDFYIGSTYETRPLDVYQECCSTTTDSIDDDDTGDYELVLTFEDGDLRMPANSKMSICEHRRIAKE